MYPTRDELREVFSREEPSAGFTARVMQQVHAEKKVRSFPYKRWSIVGAVAASLTVGIYVRQQQRRAQQPDPVVSEHADQLYQALGLAGFQIDKAREAVLQSEGEDAQ